MLKNFKGSLWGENSLQERFAALFPYKISNESTAFLQVCLGCEHDKHHTKRKDCCLCLSKTRMFLCCNDTPCKEILYCWEACLFLFEMVLRL